MTDLQISVALAQAIGWPYVEVLENACIVRETTGSKCRWQLFNFRDPAVIWPIAKRYGLDVDFKHKVAWVPTTNIGEQADTVERAIAYAVMKTSKFKLKG